MSDQSVDRKGFSDEHVLYEAQMFRLAREWVAAHWSTASDFERNVRSKPNRRQCRSGIRQNLKAFRRVVL